MNTILASIRMHCSKLNHDLSSNNITDINTCNCGNIETANTPRHKDKRIIPKVTM